MLRTPHVRTFALGTPHSRTFALRTAMILAKVVLALVVFLVVMWILGGILRAMRK